MSRVGAEFSFETTWSLRQTVTAENKGSSRKRKSRQPAQSVLRIFVGCSVRKWTRVLEVSRYQLIGSRRRKASGSTTAKAKKKKKRKHIQEQQRLRGPRGEEPIMFPFWMIDPSKQGRRRRRDTSSSVSRKRARRRDSAIAAVEALRIRPQGQKARRLQGCPASLGQFFQLAAWQGYAWMQVQGLPTMPSMPIAAEATQPAAKEETWDRSWKKQTPWKGGESWKKGTKSWNKWVNPERCCSPVFGSMTRLAVPLVVEGDVLVQGVELQAAVGQCHHLAAAARQKVLQAVQFLLKFSKILQHGAKQGKLASGATKEQNGRAKQRKLPSRDATKEQAPLFCVASKRRATPVGAWLMTASSQSPEPRDGRKLGVHLSPLPPALFCGASKRRATPVGAWLMTASSQKPPGSPSPVTAANLVFISSRVVPLERNR